MESPPPTVRLAFYSIQPDGCEIDKPPVIFIHGATASKENWNDIPANIANSTKRKVFALDLRNHGDSEWSDDFSFPIYADDVLQFMNSIQAPKAIFVGHSLGGVVVMRIAGIASDRVEKLVVEDLGVSKTIPSVQAMFVLLFTLNQEATEQMPVGLDEEEAKKFIVDFVYNGLPTEMKKNMKKPSDTTQLDNKLKPTQDSRWTFKYNIDAIRKGAIERQESHPDPAGVYSGPACFIYGQKSPFQVGKDEENIRKWFPNAEMVEIPNATHAVHSDCPKEFTEELMKFIYFN